MYGIKLLLSSILITCLVNTTTAQILIKGKVSDKSSGQPLKGASVKLLSAKTTLSTDQNGNFSIRLNSKNDSLLVAFIGYQSQRLSVQQSTTTSLDIQLTPETATLDEVSISTGYYRIPKERATGSFSTVNEQQLGQSLSPDLLSRLKGVGNSLSFDERLSDGGSPKLSIRGLSTIYAETQPLIVLNNFPFNGDLSSINPNDVENVTILKDAAAASIWGVRAANGVIVITTKKGKNNQPNQITLTANATIGAKPDVYYRSSISSADFIGVEQFLFEKGFYKTLETDASHPPLSPAVELLIAARDHQISPEQASTQLEILKQQDVRKDFEKYLYQNSLNQQYALNFNGGTEKSTWYYSLGYDDNQSASKDDYKRISLRANHSYAISPKLKINPTISYVQTQSKQGLPDYTKLTSGISQQLYPYAQLADQAGNPLTILKNYRSAYLSQTQKAGLLDWTYQPLSDFSKTTNTTARHELLLNMDANYSITDKLSFTALYQYERGQNDNRKLNDADSYDVRDMVNQYTQIAGTTLSFPVPKGGILDLNSSVTQSHSSRAQLQYNNQIEAHQISFLAGAEMRSSHLTGNQNRTYGYDQSGLISLPVNYTAKYPMYYNSGITRAIEQGKDFTDQINRYTAIYANAAYTYEDKYLLSASVRKDASNLFGVNSNQRGVPLWSAGLGWNIDKESFFRNNVLENLKFRLTYGLNGNLSKNLTALATLIQSGNNLNNVPYTTVQTYPNPDLKWEKVSVFNAGIDFGFKNGILKGSIEYYQKNGKNLISNFPVDQTTGAVTGKVQKNVATMQTEGLDFQLETKNIDRKFGWNSSFLLNYNKDKVTSYFTAPNLIAANYLTAGLGISPVIGKPVQSIYTYSWNGLDSQTGDPIGVFQGQPSKNYGDIVYGSTLNDLEYSGRAQPLISGSLINTFRYQNFSLYVNVTYRAGYYFQRTSISYSSLYNNWLGHGDFAGRWQKTGDELSTSVPSMVYPVDPSRDDFYNNSAVLVEKADNIRLQDLNLSYSINGNQLKTRPFRSLVLTAYVRSLGILWKASKQDLDPDYFGTYPAVTTFSFGLKVNL